MLRSAQAPHIVFLSHLDWNLYIFRRPIMKALVEEGWRVTALSPEGPYVGRFQEDGIEYVPYKLDRRGTNPLRELGVVRELHQILRRLSPDLVHTFTVKPNIYGTLATRLAGVPRVANSVTGLGSWFVESGRPNPMQLFLKSLYALSGRLTNATVFQNTDDAEFFWKCRLASRSKTVLIRGSGVDLQRLSPHGFSSEQRIAMRAELGIPRDAVVVTQLARLIWDKGIREFCEAARQLRREYGAEIRFLLLGYFYDGNPNAVPKEYVDAAVASGDVIYAGWRDDIPAILNASDIVALPSFYREGIPVCLQEGMAMGKPLVTTDSPGCRDTVDEGENGFLIPLRNSPALAGAIRKLVDDPELRRRMGLASREKAEREFDVREIVRQHIALYHKLLSAGESAGVERLQAQAPVSPEGRGSVGHPLFERVQRMESTVNADGGQS